jgi:ATP-dependent DNA helicase RecG
MKAEIVASSPEAGESRQSWTRHETPGAYEMRPCQGAPWTSLDEAALRVFFSGSEATRAEGIAPAVAAIESLARQAKFTVRRDSAMQPTVAGYALFGVHPEARRPAWRMTALRLVGTEAPVLVVDRLDTEGPAPQAIQQVEAFLRRHLGGAEGQASGLPLAAAMEAIANAVAHRDYAAPSPVFARLYDDRLEVENPGGLLPGSTLEELAAGSESCLRNPIIAGALRRMGFMAPAGRGMALMRDEMARLGAPPPEFDADRQHFRVTLRARRAGRG